MFMVSLAGLVWAGGLSVSPTQLKLGAGQMSGEIRLNNDGDETVSVQASLVAWSQDETGAETFVDAADLAIYPRIFSLDSGASQIVRVGRLPGSAVHQPAIEEGYRLILRELPIDASNNVIGITRRLTLPVWLVPDKVHRQWDVSGVSVETAAHTETGAAMSALVARIVNRGNVHQRLVDVSFIALDANGAEQETVVAPGWYVLAGADKPFAAPLPDGFCDQVQVLRLRLRLAGETRDSDWPRAAICAGP